MRAAFALAVLVACNSSDPTPVTPPAPLDDAGPIIETDAGVVTSPTSPPASAPLDAQGGILQSSDGLATLAVPPIAIATPATIAIAPSTRPVDATIASAAYELSPNGVTFDRDLDLCITTTSRVNANDACLAYFDEAANAWKCEDTCLERRGDGNVLCGRTNHFTSFAILLSSNGATSEAACRSTLVPPNGGGVASRDDRAVVTFVGGTLAKPTRIAVTALPITGAELASPAYEVGPSGTPLAREVELCIRPEQGKAAGCLGYLDRTGSAPAWRCEDRCLSRRGDHLCGTTTHFTSFALLLGGSSSSASCNDAVVPEAGGTVTSLDGTAAFVAQQGTFVKPTRVTIARAPSEPRLGSDVVELLADTPFAKPGRVCLTASPGADLTSACLGFKTAAGGWTCQGTCLKKGTGDLLCGDTDHFTSFAILISGGTGITCPTGP